MKKHFFLGICGLTALWAFSGSPARGQTIAEVDYIEFSDEEDEAPAPASFTTTSPASHFAPPAGPPLAFDYPKGELWAGYPAEACGGGRCGPSVWFEEDALLWWVKGQRTPPLVTASPLGTPRDAAGVLPNATVLFGGENINDELRFGGRARLGWWLDPCGCNGIQLSFLALEDRSDDFYAASTGNPALARPFFNAAPSGPNNPAPIGQDAALIAFTEVDGQGNLIPGFAGDVAVITSSNVYSGEALARRFIGCWSGMETYMLAGYQYFQLDEGLFIRQRTESVGPAGLPFAPGTRLDIFDAFDVQNNFHGGVIGFAHHYNACRWTFDSTVKVALGSVQSRVRIDGGAVVTDGGVNALPGGLLALPTNIGEYRNNDFAVLPEASFKFGYCLTDHVTFTAGYTFMYLTNVARPGDQIDTVVNANLLTPDLGDDLGPQRPAFALRQSDVWAQGATLGLTFIW